jgi:3-oxoacyl-[acyl-carrier-protein] synthase I
MEAKTGAVITNLIMREVFVVSDNIVSPLGLTTSENFARLKKRESAIRQQERPELAKDPFYASLFEPEDFSGDDNPRPSFSRFEKILISSIGEVLTGSKMDPGDPKTLLIVSTTKGNIGLLPSSLNDLNGAIDQLSLPSSAQRIASHFGFSNPPVVVSHACISGLLAIICATRLLQSGIYDQAIVSGGDLVSRFILSGFESFQAVSSRPCRPFDANRDGITLGEAAATLALSVRKKKSDSPIQVAAAAVSNDANHISGPSRTGEELFQAIGQTLQNASVSAQQIDFISAHGTATRYNDEMEAKAIALAGMQGVPVNSLKGYFGHTLGAAGLLESVISMESLRENLILPTFGYSDPGTEQVIQVTQDFLSGSIRKCLKTASGFGGCNAALLLSKE